VFGLSSSINNTGAAVGPMIGASIAAALGYASSFFAAAAILLATAIAAWALARSPRNVDTRVT
jgi:predicted MFS family arabinose efflux permease